MSKDIQLAKYAGFCYGVKRAVDTAKKLKSDNPDKNVYIYGELIHNADVINELSALGIITIYEIPEKVENSICIIRSHGASPDVFNKLKNAGFEIHDLTCPDVKKVQQKAIELIKQEYFLVIIGKSEHPEVIAIRENAEQYGKNILVANSLEELKLNEEILKANKRIGVVVQTTQTISVLNSLLNYLTAISKELHIYNTICASTSKRQSEAKELAENNDLILVVGSKKSANTTHLAEIVSNITNTIHIENANELDKYNELISNSNKIAVTAGASTPDNIIEQVINKVKGGL